MVGHQAVAEYLDTALLLQLAEAGEVVLVIAPLGENELAVMTSLNDVVRITRHDESPCPWHDRLLSFKAGSLAFDSERGRELAQGLARSGDGKINLSLFVIDAALLLQLAEAAEVLLVIARRGEDELAVVASLNDVMRVTRHDESACPWHERLLSLETGSLAFESEWGRELAQGSLLRRGK